MKGLWLGQLVVSGTVLYWRRKKKQEHRSLRPGTGHRIGWVQLSYLGDTLMSGESLDRWVWDTGGNKYNT